MEIVFNTIMLFDYQSRTISLNGEVNNFEHNAIVHVKLCDLLCRSLNAAGYKHRIFTNDLHYFTKHSKCLFYYDIVELNISNVIPNDLTFYCSMHKLEVCKILSEQSNDDSYNFIIDNDCIFLKPFNNNINDLINAGIPLFYNITNQMLPCLGHETMTKIIQLTSGCDTFSQWMGGELIGGKSNLFSGIYQLFHKRIKEINTYEVQSLGHFSDECFYSAYFDFCLLNNVTYADLGLSSILNRFWELDTMHVPDHWQKAKLCNILHLPASKNYLSIYSDNIENDILFKPEDFISKFEKYLIEKRGYNIKINIFTPRFNRNRSKIFLKNLLKYFKNIFK